MVFTEYTKQRILYYYLKEKKTPTISLLLKEEGGSCIKKRSGNVLTKLEATKCITRQPGSDHLSKITAEVKDIVEERMRQDDETTAFQLHRLLNERGYNVNIRIVLCCCTSLGWMSMEVCLASLSEQ